MSDSDDLENDDQERNWKQLRDQAKQGQAAQDELAKAQRELAFARAGIPLDDPKMSYFVKGYDGALDAEAIKAAAERDGFLGQPAPTPAPAIPADEQAALERVGSQMAGGDTYSAPPGITDELMAAHKSGAFRGTDNPAESIAQWLEGRQVGVSREGAEGGFIGMEGATPIPGT